MRNIDRQLPHRFELACIENTIAEKAGFQPIDRARSWQRHLHATSQQFFRVVARTRYTRFELLHALRRFHVNTQFGGFGV